MRKALVVLAAVALVATGGLPVQAHEQTRNDANDTVGPLDIEWIKLQHESLPGDFQFTFKMRTYGEWGPRFLDGESGLIQFLVKTSPETYNRITIMYDFGGDERLEATATPCNTTECHPESSVTHIATKPNPHTVVTRFRRSDIPSTGHTVRWKGVTLLGHGCDGPCHRDDAPNDGWAIHDLIH